MASFPLFVDLKNKKCLIVGAGNIAYRKIEILLRYEADIVVVAPQINASILALEEVKALRILQKDYDSSLLEGAFLVIAATSSLEINSLVYEDARVKNIPVNVVDDPARCTFFFPSVIKRGDLSIGISTHGKFPALSKKLRKLLSEEISEEYQEILTLLGEFRTTVREDVSSQGQRERILKQVVEEFYTDGNITGAAMRQLLNKYKEEL